MYMSVFVSFCELVPVSAGVHGTEVLNPLELELQAKGVSHPAWVLGNTQIFARIVHTLNG